MEIAFVLLGTGWMALAVAFIFFMSKSRAMIIPHLILMLLPVAIWKWSLFFLFSGSDFFSRRLREEYLSVNGEVGPMWWFNSAAMVVALFWAGSNIRRMMKGAKSST